MSDWERKVVRNIKLSGDSLDENEVLVTKTDESTGRGYTSTLHDALVYEMVTCEDDDWRLTQPELEAIDAAYEAQCAEDDGAS